jgi:hypothetical protein
MDGAADLQGCVNPSRSDWPSLSIAPSIQQQLHPAHSNNSTQPSPPTNLKAKKEHKV